MSPEYERPTRDSEEWTVGQEMQIVQRGIYHAKTELKAIRKSRALTWQSVNANLVRRDALVEERRTLHARNHELMRINAGIPLVQAEAQLLPLGELDVQQEPTPEV
jgi:hypothetical protein